uniref:Uncharacterized protein n=1 Tax=Geladintestivirus 2 TaxID=3233134 RepID=A0AAU8MJT5_9CAUD
MFSALSQGSLVHILDKTDGIKYKIGEIIGVTQPTNFTGTFGTPAFNNGTISLKVKVDGNTIEYKEIPSSSSIISYNNGTTTVCETKQALVAEIENTLQNRKQILANKTKYEADVTDCENLLKELNPQFAKDKERDDRIEGLNSKVTSMESKLDKILNALSTNTNNIKF